MQIKLELIKNGLWISNNKATYLKEAEEIINTVLNKVIIIDDFEFFKNLARYLNVTSKDQAVLKDLPAKYDDINKYKSNKYISFGRKIIPYTNNIGIIDLKNKLLEIFEIPKLYRYNQENYSSAAFFNICLAKEVRAHKEEIHNEIINEIKLRADNAKKVIYENLLNDREEEIVIDSKKYNLRKMIKDPSMANILLIKSYEKEKEESLIRDKVGVLNNKISNILEARSGNRDVYLENEVDEHLKNVRSALEKLKEFRVHNFLEYAEVDRDDLGNIIWNYGPGFLKFTDFNENLSESINNYLENVDVYNNDIVKIAEETTYQEKIGNKEINELKNAYKRYVIEDIKNFDNINKCISNIDNILENNNMMLKELKDDFYEEYEKEPVMCIMDDIKKALSANKVRKFRKTLRKYELYENIVDDRLYKRITECKSDKEELEKKLRYPDDQHNAKWFKDTYELIKTSQEKIKHIDYETAVHIKALNNAYENSNEKATTR